MEIVIDTNFLLIPAQFKIDIFEELRKFSNDIATFDICIKELGRLSKKKSKNGISARTALSLIENKNLKIVRAKENRVDSALMNHAKKFNCIVATNDRKLIKELKNNGIRVIRLRQKKYLVME